MLPHLLSVSVLARLVSSISRLWRGALISLIIIGGFAYAQDQQNSPPIVRIDLTIQLAIARNHALKAARTQIQQSQAQEITAAIRPNPAFTYDDLFLPVFSPSQFNPSTLDNITEFDLGVGYTFERGGKRKARIRAARDQTAVTRSLVSDNERTLTFSVVQ